MADIDLPTYIEPKNRSLRISYTKPFVSKSSPIFSDTRRKRTSRTRRKVTFTADLTEAQYHTFETWFLEECEGGTKPFNWINTNDSNEVYDVMFEAEAMPEVHHQTLGHYTIGFNLVER